MPARTALLIIDVQESFRHRPFWSEAQLPAFLERLNTLAHGSVAAGVPIVRVLHVASLGQADNPFAHASGHVRPLQGLDAFAVAATFEKHRHSALVGTGLEPWLREHGITRLIVTGIRTEQCCETTARHASDEGWEVDFVSEATLTFDMRSPRGKLLSADELVERTETVLVGRFANVVTAEQALERAQAAAAVA